MNRRTVLLLLGGAAVAACDTGTPAPPALGPDGQPLPRLYRISSSDARRIPFRALDAVNALRAGAGVPALELDSRLTAAAETHSRDMSLQNRPWHFGSDGSSPIDRARRVGFDGQLLGEAISETYESELETIAAWMQEPGPRRVILEPEARRMGFAFFQEENGKIWWTMTVGTNASGTV
ncbi:MAG: CAP domain-containing protein [Pseudomonadota bacterium]